MARRWITGEGGEGWWEEEKTGKKVASKVDPVKKPATSTLTVDRPDTTDDYGKNPTSISFQNGGNMGSAQPGGGGNLTVQAPAMGATDTAGFANFQPPAPVTTPPVTTPPVTTDPTQGSGSSKVMASYLDPVPTTDKAGIESQLPYDAGPKTETGKKLGQLDYRHRNSYKDYVASPTNQGIDKEYEEKIGEEAVSYTHLTLQTTPYV